MLNMAWLFWLQKLTLITNFPKIPNTLGTQYYVWLLCKDLILRKQIKKDTNFFFMQNDAHVPVFLEYEPPSSLFG